MVDLEYLSIHLSVLGLKPSSNRQEIKKAYHLAARENHPDLFPDAERPRRELLMMRINEAYMTLSAAFADMDSGKEERPSTAPGGYTPPRYEPFQEPPAGAVGALKNGDYVYYKRGLESYREGRRRFFDRTNDAGRPQHFVPDGQLLQLAVGALRLFQYSYSCFLRVVSDYPESIWVKDSRFHLWRLEQYNRVYTRICRQLASRVMEKEKYEEE